MSKHIFFVVLALAVTANSNALPPSAVDETSEIAVVNMDLATTTHGESKRLLHVSDKMPAILEEERAGKAPSKVMLFGAEISTSSEAERERELKLAAKELKLKQPFEADAGVAGGGTSSTISELIDRRGLNRAEVAKREQLLQQYIGSSDRFGEGTFNMAVGSVYFEHEASLLERGERRKDLIGEIELIRTVLEYGEEFQSSRVNFGKVLSLALAMYRHESSKPGIPVIVDMAFGSVFLTSRMK